MEKTSLVHWMLGIGLLASLGMYAKSIVDYRNHVYGVVNNPVSITERKVREGETYWEYMQDMKKKCSRLEHIPKKSIIEKLIELNGENLLAGTKIKIPQYCKSRQTLENE